MFISAVRLAIGFGIQYILPVISLFGLKHPLYLGFNLEDQPTRLETTQSPTQQVSWVKQWEGGSGEVHHKLQSNAL